jgi:hypothetical protein
MLLASRRIRMFFALMLAKSREKYIFGLVFSKKSAHKKYKIILVI